MRKRHYFFLLSLLLCIAGCERGCTTRHTLDSESKVYQLHGEQITVIVQVIDNRNSRAINRNIFRRSVTHTYSVNIDVQYRGQEIEDVYIEGVNEPDKVDLDKVLQRVSVACSRDGNHLAIGMDQKIAEVLHFYKDQPIRNATILAMNPPADTPWSALKIESFLSPRELILNYLLVDCEFFMGDEELIQAFVDDVSPSDTAHKVLLEQWPQCDVAYSYYSEPVVRRLSKNSTWKRWAETRSMTVLREDVQAAGFDGTDTFLAALNSRKVQDLQDSTLVSQWGGKGDQRNNDLLINRLKSQHGLSPERRKLLNTQANQGVANFLADGDSDHHREAIYCLRVLDALGDTATADKVIRLALGPQMNKFNCFDMIEVVYENYAFYTPTQQKFIRSKTDEVFGRVPDYARSTLFRAAATFSECKLLKAWKKTYANDLANDPLPEGC